MKEKGKNVTMGSNTFKFARKIVGPLVQSAERGADKAKVVSSTLTRTSGFKPILKLISASFFSKRL